LHEAQVIDEVTEEVKKEEELSPPEALEKIMKQLPDEVTEEQREKVKSLLKEYRSIISTGEHDIGRTNLVEHRIDTGGHRPIRQPLRRHLFQHLEFSDDEVIHREGRRHGNADGLSRRPPANEDKSSSPVAEAWFFIEPRNLW